MAANLVGLKVCNVNTFQKALSLLTPAERRRGGLVLGMVMIMALLETAGVASIMPFLAVLGNPSLVQTDSILSALYAGLGYASVNSFLVALGAGVFGLVLFAAGFRILTTYVMNRFTEMRRHSIGQRLLETYLRQPYAFFLNRHSGDMSKSILSEVDQLVQNVFKPGIQAMAHGVVAIAIITLLIIVDVWLALSVGLVVGGMYSLIFLAVRGLLSRLGRDRVNANRERFTAAGDALGGIKVIKLLGREQAYLSRFREPSIQFARHQSTNQTFAQVPKYLIEAIGVGGVLALSLFLMSTNDGMGAILPILGLYAFAGYKLLPAVQNVYAGFAKLRFGAGAVQEIYQDLQQRATESEICASVDRTITPRFRIVLDDVTFKYPNSDSPVLCNINLTIPVGTVVGVIGSTGAGKTTLIDILLGLLRPTEGSLIVDDVEISESNLRCWQQALGYVPQEIFLTDSTVAENIALGIPDDAIDPDAVVRCARMAQLHDFIMGELPQQYGTAVGERGVRLSGGQRQRIGIARALYHDPAVLVFDEGTSALDAITEQTVMQAVHNLRQHKTIILVAHRLNSLVACDQIFMLEEGGVAVQGRYGEMIKRLEANELTRVELC